MSMNDNIVKDRRWIVMDLDGTLCDCSHRVHLAQAKDWEAFHGGIMDDRPHPEAVEMIEILNKSDYEILLCTGRPVEYYDVTCQWLNKNSITDISLIAMRPTKDYSPDHELKPKLVAQVFGSMEEALKNVLLVFDDRDRVVEAFRNLGFSCWQVNVGEY